MFFYYVVFIKFGYLLGKYLLRGFVTQFISMKYITIRTLIMGDSTMDSNHDCEFRTSNKFNDEHHLLKVNLPRKWSQMSYTGEDRVPQGIDPSAGSWSLFYLKRNNEKQFTTPAGKIICFEIQHPDNFNFDKELLVVKKTLSNLTQQQKQIAEYWGDGPATKQWTPIIDRLLTPIIFHLFWLLEF